MIIRRIRLVNFRKYSELELEFPEGLIGIIGKNGAGKTTILEAIGFALYGNSASRLKGKGVRLDGCVPGASCLVELDFGLGGTSYTIVRELRGTDEHQAAKMYQGSEDLVAHQARGVEAKVRRLLGLDYHTFIRSIFARQKEVALLSDERPEERRRAIRRMMGIERIERAYKLAREDKREKEEFIKGAQIAIADLQSKTVELQKSAPDIEQKREESGAAKRQVQQSQKSEKNAREGWEAQEEKRGRFTELDKKLNGLKTSLSGAEERATNLSNEVNELQNAGSRLEALKPQLVAFEKVRKEKEQLDKAKGAFDERTRLARDIATLESQIAQEAQDTAQAERRLHQYASLAKQHKRAMEDIRIAERDLKDKEQGSKKAQSALDQKIGLLGQLAESVRRVREEGATGDCPTCLRPLGENFPEIMAHFKEEKKTLESERARLDAQVLVRERERSLANKALKARQKEHQQVLKQEKARDVLRAELSAAHKNLQGARTTLRTKQKRHTMLGRIQYDQEAHRRATTEFRDLTKIHREGIELKRDASRLPARRKELRQTRQRITAWEKQAKALERTLQQLAFEPSAYEQSKSAHTAAVAKLRQSETAAADIRQALEVLNDRQKRLDAEIKQKQDLKKRIEGEEETIRYLAQLEYVLKDFQSDLISRIRPLIAQRASTLLDQVTEGRYSRIELDEDYGISIVDDGVSHPIRRYSGGEEDLTNLCLRIAISQIIAEQMGGSGSGLIALDEVFGSQDRERRERLIRALQNLTPTFRQIMFITHVEDLQERVPNVLHITEDSDHLAVANWLN